MRKWNEMEGGGSTSLKDARLPSLDYSIDSVKIVDSLIRFSRLISSSAAERENVGFYVICITEFK